MNRCLGGISQEKKISRQTVPLRYVLVVDEHFFRRLVRRRYIGSKEGSVNDDADYLMR